ncbi:hypothetical protein ES703_105702 [subsurface metagenome]
MSRDRKPRMTKNRLLLIQTIQKGIRAVREDLLDLKQNYLEPSNPHRDRRLRYEWKRKYLEQRGINIYEKLK